MVDEFKQVKDSIIKNLIGGLSQLSFVTDSVTPPTSHDHANNRASRDSKDGSLPDLLFSILSRAGKSKDEIVRLLAQEVGSAIAAMLKEPLREIAKTHKVVVSFEIAPKSAKHDRKQSETADKSPKESSHRKSVRKKVKQKVQPQRKPSQR